MLVLSSEAMVQAWTGSSPFYIGLSPDAVRFGLGASLRRKTRAGYKFEFWACLN